MFLYTTTFIVKPNEIVYFAAPKIFFWIAMKKVFGFLNTRHKSNTFPDISHLFYKHVINDIDEDFCSCSGDDESGWSRLIQYHPRKQLSVVFTKISNVEIVSKYTLGILNHVCEYQLIWTSFCVLYKYFKKKVFSIEIPGVVLVLLPISPTLTFHQNTNHGSRKRISLFFFH